MTSMFRLLGQFLAKGLMDSRIIDIPFSRIFMKLVLDHEIALTTSTVRAVDPALGKSLTDLVAYVNAKEAILTATAIVSTCIEPTTF